MSEYLIDKELIDRLKSDDDTALSVIYKKYWQVLFISAHNILKDQHACEDIIQELFIKLWNNRQAIDINVSLKAYLYASIRYEVYRQVRTGMVRSEIFDNLTDRLQTPATCDSIEYKQLIRQVNAVVDKLPEKCREVYKLSREQQLSHKQIAGQLNISTKTVENQLTKALRYLRTSLSTTAIVVMVYLLLK